MNRRPRSNLVRVFAAPAAIAVVSTVGLVTALVDDRLGDWISWLSLATPLAAVAWGWARRS